MHRARRPERREPRQDGHQGGRALLRRVASRPRTRPCCGCGCPTCRAGRAARPVRRVRDHGRRALGGGRRILPRRSRRPASAMMPQRVMRQAFAGMLWTQAVLTFSTRKLARSSTAPPRFAASGETRATATGPTWSTRRDLDARQVGVPVVRGVGPRVPRDHAVAGRRRFRQGAAAI